MMCFSTENGIMTKGMELRSVEMSSDYKAAIWGKVQLKTKKKETSFWDRFSNELFYLGETSELALESFLAGQHFDLSLHSVWAMPSFFPNSLHQNFFDYFKHHSVQDPVNTVLHDLFKKLFLLPFRATAAFHFGAAEICVSKSF